MAQLYVNTVTASSFRWSVTGLGSSFTSSNYTSVGISTSYFTSGTTTRPNVLTYTQSYTGTTSTNTTTFYHSLSAGTYTLYGFASTGGKYYSCGSVTITVPSSDSTAPTIGTLTVDVPSHGYVNTTTFTASAVVTDNVGVSNVTCTFNGSTYSYGSKSGSTYYFRLNTPTSGATRTLTFNAYDSAGNSRSKSTSVWCCYDGTAPSISYIEAVSVGTAIKVGLTASDSLSGVGEVSYRISPPSSSQPAESSFGNLQSIDVSNGGSNSYTYYSDGNGNSLSYGSKYWIQYTVKDKAGNYSSKKYASCVVEYAKPSAWTWTQAELNAFQNGGSISTLTWQRWNAFVDNVVAMAKWKIGDSYTQYDLANARMTQDNKKLTANKFNLVRFAIGSMNSSGSGISAVVSGDRVMGSYFTQLRDRLNGIERSSAIGSMEQIHNIDLLYDIGRIEDAIRSE